MPRTARKPPTRADNELKAWTNDVFTGAAPVLARRAFLAGYNAPHDNPAADQLRELRSALKPFLPFLEGKLQTGPCMHDRGVEGMDLLVNYQALLTAYKACRHPVDQDEWDTCTSCISAFCRCTICDLVVVPCDCGGNHGA